MVGQSSLIADTNTDILKVLKGFEESGEIDLETAEAYCKVVNLSGGDILSLYMMDVARFSTIDGKYRGMVYKELMLMKNFSMLLGTRMLLQPFRELSQAEIDRRNSFLQHGADIDEQRSEGHG